MPYGRLNSIPKQLAKYKGLNMAAIDRAYLDDLIKQFRG